MQVRLPPLHRQPQVRFTDVVVSTVQQDVSLDDQAREDMRNK